MIWLGSWEAEGVCATRKHFPFLGNSETNTSFLANLVLPAELLLNEWVGWGGRAEFVLGGYKATSFSGGSELAHVFTSCQSIRASGQRSNTNATL